MDLRMHRFRLIAFALVVLLMAVLAATLFTPRDAGANRHRVLMKTTELTARIAQRLGVQSVEESAWNWRHELFKADLDYRVRQGQLSRLSAQVDRDLPGFSADLRAFAKSNRVQLVFTQTELTNDLTGGTCTVYVRSGDADTIRDFLELLSRVPTGRSSE